MTKSSHLYVVHVNAGASGLPPAVTVASKSPNLRGDQQSVQVAFPRQRRLSWVKCRLQNPPVLRGAGGLAGREVVDVFRRANNNPDQNWPWIVSQDRRLYFGTTFPKKIGLSGGCCGIVRSAPNKDWCGSRSGNRYTHCRCRIELVGLQHCQRHGVGQGHQRCGQWYYPGFADIRRIAIEFPGIVHFPTG